MKKRIWELDASRGLFLLLMIAFHLWYDLIYLYGVVELTVPRLYAFVSDWGGVLFILISGICATLGSHPVKRGLQVLGCGLIITAVTAGLYLLGFAGKELIIYFGILHCLGSCMLLWARLSKLPTPVLAVLGAAMIAAGLYLRHYVRVDLPWLIPFGLTGRSFVSSDYFPLLPNLGYFLAGAFLGRLVYAKKQTLLPCVDPEHPVVRFFSFFGKHSLFIYLLHQPVLTGLVGICVLLF